jgi:hypothetical protein
VTPWLFDRRHDDEVVLHDAQLQLGLHSVHYSLGLGGGGGK